MAGIFKINNNEIFGSDGTFSGTIGSNASGFTGVKTVDVWHLSTNQTGSGEFQYDSLTRSSTSNGGANLGTGMTLNGSGSNPGIFTFPTTGIWKVEAFAGFSLNNSSRYVFFEILVSTSGTGGSFSSMRLGKTYVNRTDSNTTHTSCNTTCVLDVTTSGTSGTALKFSVSVANSSVLIHGDAPFTTYFIFTRLGDT